MSNTLAVTAAVAVTASAATPEGVVDPARCRPAAEAFLKGVGPGWAVHAPDVDLCPVNNRSGKIVFSLLTVRLDKLRERGIPFGPTDAPKTVILDTELKIVGRLPDHYPWAQYYWTKFEFRDWREGLPQTVRYVYLGGHRVDPYYSDVLKWDHTRREFDTISSREMPFSVRCTPLPPVPGPGYAPIYDWDPASTQRWESASGRFWPWCPGTLAQWKSLTTYTPPGWRPPAGLIRK